MTTPQVQRPEVPLVADERTMLEFWLDYHRATLLMKCSGLSGEQLKLRSVEPSTLSLLGLVRHMTEVERGWFRRGVAGQKGPDVAPSYYSDERPDGDFDVADADPAAMLTAYTEEVERCRAATAGIPLDKVVGRHSVRWIYLHMIEEYARHNGHADLLRERIDGATGQ
ncbi:MAG TPA: DinB family protein [Actinomycetes bacterium]|jgi:uncharacterized damage-inducible protein DinB|nr:DinB family protein [Actinomycetes bacterium]